MGGRKIRKRNKKKKNENKRERERERRKKKLSKSAVCSEWKQIVRRGKRNTSQRIVPVKSVEEKFVKKCL